MSDISSTLAPVRDSVEDVPLLVVSSKVQKGDW